jgi:uncharacterized membrane protein
MATSTATIGMRLDTMISELDSLSSTQLYGIIVAATVGLCMVLLGTGNADVQLNQQQQQQKTSPDTSTTGRQPRWHIFRWVNYLCTAGFVYSLAHFWHNASYYLYQQPDQLIHFLVGWSVFVGYFFGFFGVSLIHQDMVSETETAEETVAVTKAVAAPEDKR